MWEGDQVAGAVTAGTSLHLGKTSLQHEGLRRFKRNLGAVERRIEYVKYDLRRNRFLVEDGRGRRAGTTRCFGGCRWFYPGGPGELLYKHWA
jgi:hypothetical protein